MIFNSRKLRNLFVSGLLATGLGAGNVNASGLLETTGLLVRQLFNGALNLGKYTAAGSAISKLGTTIAFKSGSLNEDNIGSAEKCVMDNLGPNGLGLSGDCVDGILEYTLYNPDKSYGVNLQKGAKEVGAFVGLKCVEKFVNGFSNNGSDKTVKTVVIPAPMSQSQNRYGY